MCLAVAWFMIYISDTSAIKCIKLSIEFWGHLATEFKKEQTSDVLVFTVMNTASFLYVSPRTTT